MRHKSKPGILVNGEAPLSWMNSAVVVSLVSNVLYGDATQGTFRDIHATARSQCTKDFRLPQSQLCSSGSTACEGRSLKVYFEHFFRPSTVQVEHLFEIILVGLDSSEAARPSSSQAIASKLHAFFHVGLSERIPPRIMGWKPSSSSNRLEFI